MFDDVYKSLYTLWLINSSQVNEAYDSLKQDILIGGKGKFKQTQKRTIHIEDILINKSNIQGDQFITNTRIKHRCMGDVQMYGEHTDVWGMYRCGDHTDAPRPTDHQTYPHMPAKYTCVLYLL